MKVNELLGKLIDNFDNMTEEEQLKEIKEYGGSRYYESNSDNVKMTCGFPIKASPAEKVEAKIIRHIDFNGKKFHKGDEVKIVFNRESISKKNQNFFKIEAIIVDILDNAILIHEKGQENSAILCVPIHNVLLLEN